MYPCVSLSPHEITWTGLGRWVGTEIAWEVGKREHSVDREGLGVEEMMNGVSLSGNEN